MQQVFPNRKLFVLSFAVVLLSVLFGIALWKWQAKLQLQGGSEEKPLEGLKVFGSVPPL